MNDAPFEIENPDSEIAIMPWGSSKGVAREAYQQLIEKDKNLGWIYSVALNPLPEDIKEELKRKKLVIVPELNYQGQWSSILRMEGINAVSVTQFTGLPFKPTELANKISDKIVFRKLKSIKFGYLEIITYHGEKLNFGNPKSSLKANEVMSGIGGK